MDKKKQPTPNAAPNNVGRKHDKTGGEAKGKSRTGSANKADTAHTRRTRAR